MRDGAPLYAPSIAADKVSGIHLAYAVMAALLYRERTGEVPGYVEVPMFELMAAFSLSEHLGAATFEEDGKVGYVRVLSPGRRPYKTKDGWVGVLPYTRAQLDQDPRRDRPPRGGRARLVQERHRAQPPRRRALRDPGRAPCPRAPRRSGSPSSSASTSRMRRCARRRTCWATRTSTTWASSPATSPATTPVKRTLRQAVNVEDVAAAPDLPPPPLGADTEAVLREAGCSEAEIAAVLARIVGCDRRESGLHRSR